MVFMLVAGIIFFVFGFHYYDERSWRFRTFRQNLFHNRAGFVAFPCCRERGEKQRNVATSSGSSPKARPRSATPPAKSPTATNAALTRRKCSSGEGFESLWPPLIKADAATKARVGELFNA